MKAPLLVCFKGNGRHLNRAVALEDVNVVFLDFYLSCIHAKPQQGWAGADVLVRMCWAAGLDLGAVLCRRRLRELARCHHSQLHAVIPHVRDDLRAPRRARQGIAFGLDARCQLPVDRHPPVALTQ